jgi:hypothetical protein
MVKQKNAAVAEVAARRHWREQDARLLLEAWRGSGQTLTAFAQHYGVHPERLGRWHRLLRAQPESQVRFHPVRVRMGEPRSAESEKIELVLRDGRSIRVPQKFDAEDLRRLLAVVEAVV